MLFCAWRVIEKDLCEIIGSEGSLSFPFFGQPVVHLTKSGKTETFSFEVLKHVQQPMIAATVDYFLNKKPNPCSAEIGLEVMNVLEKFTHSPNHIVSTHL